MRRGRNRIFFLFIISIICYISWNLLNGTYQISLTNNEPEEEQAYVHAVSAGLPLIHNTKLCSSNKIDLIFVIISFGSHFLERQAIRETWGSMPYVFNVRSQILFVIGYQTGNNIYSDLVNEAQHEKDILYLTIDDKLMTVKELHAYDWLDKYCSNVTYIFKTDDDLFVNSILLHEIIRELKTKSDEIDERYLYNISLQPLFNAQLNLDVPTFLFGWAYESSKAERNATMGQYYVTYEEYPRETYPRHCSTFGYLMNSKTRKLLADEGLNDKKPFRFADIYITGVLPEKFNFACEILPFGYHQSNNADECITRIKQNNLKDVKASKRPLLVCSTGRHTGKNTFPDYYRIWAVLKYIYGDRLSGKRSKS
ncbi:unnamed protein product [Adineta steineri]|uniref:Hexosyltransferase n=1 Tax=Adineta steineri TaxID=433720 RepID=A0A813WYH6_9BILA|nr:unnamed protein product [Adineta steineri]CAF1242566.1 unnamed protein product [Adineta steineri]